MNTIKGAGWFIVLGGLWLGSQGCMFVHDTECETDRDCDSGRVCSSGTCQGPGGDNPGPQPQLTLLQLCTNSVDAATGKCSISYVYRQPSIDDCVKRGNAQPAACLNAYRSALSCESSQSIWTCSTSEGGVKTGIPSGCSSQIDAQRLCVQNGGSSSGSTGG